MKLRTVVSARTDGARDGMTAVPAAPAEPALDQTVLGR